jgi:1-acyl-sn-glycerol-3-phosphate acyltransferase
MDHLAIGAAVKLVHDRKVYFLSKQQLHGSALARFWHRSMGSIPMGNAQLSADSYRLCKSVLQSGNFLCIYPEGRINSSLHLSRFTTGAFRLAALAEAPILLVCLHDTGSLLPKGSWLPSRNRVCIEFLDIIPPSDLPRTDPKQCAVVAERSQALIREAIGSRRPATADDMISMTALIDELRAGLPWSQRVGERELLHRRIAILSGIAGQMQRELGA